MADKTAPSTSDKSLNSIDLDALSGLNFGPDWADEKTARSSKLKHFDEPRAAKSKAGRPAPSAAARDRKSGSRPGADRSDRKPDRAGYGGRESGRERPPAVFQPTVKVDLFPQDEAFDALVKRLRASARTYQLFEIAHLLLEKSERFVVLLTPLRQKGSDAGTSPLLHFSVPGHLPFESEAAAINYVIKEHLDVYFEVEAIEVDPPKGNFQMVNRCGITGELLGPPNYHRYQEFVQRHFAARISGMSMERFQSKIVASKEQEDIDAWVASMTQGARYVLKDRQENEPESFDSLESARRFLLAHRKDKVVGSGESVRFAGRDIERLPRGNIRQSVENYIQQQKLFPLESANNIRGRLRRHKFAVYKKGSKGVSYVCAVKRKFRDSSSVFTDSIRDLIDFIELHPNIPASKLSSQYIGIDIEKQKPAVLEMQEVEGSQVPDASSATPADCPDTPAADTPAAPAAAAVETSTQAIPKTELSAADQKQLHQLMLDLRWLITEGYVTEYGDGRLFAPAPLPEPSKKDKPARSEQAADKPPAQPAPLAADAPLPSPEPNPKPPAAADVVDTHTADSADTAEATGAAEAVEATSNDDVAAPDEAAESGENESPKDVI